MNYVIGDSHVSIFSGQDHISEGFPNIHGDLLPNFRTGNVSAYLAYNFGQPEHPVTVTVDKYLSKIPEGSTVIFSFGEIDCRCHVMKQPGPKCQVVQDIVNRYTTGLETYMDRYEVYALLPHVIKLKPDDDIDSAVGTWLDITAAGMLFNAYMRFWSNDRCLSVFDWTYNYEIFEQHEYYQDDTHLSQKALPFVLSECQNRGIEI